MNSSPLIFARLRLSLFLLALFLLPTPALAQAPVWESQAVVDFPHSITFTLRVKSPSPITKVVLRYQVERLTCFEEVAERHPPFTQGLEVEAGWEWLMKKAGGLPPGARIKYQWLVWDAQGERWESPASYLSFDDLRYPWKKLSQDGLSLFWYEGNESFTSRVLRAAEAALKRLHQEIGASLEQPVKLYIYDSAEALRGARVFPQEWEAGVAFPDYGTVAIAIPPDRLGWGERAIAHELTHLLIYQLTFNCYTRLPTWLSEGLAMYGEGELSPDMKARLQQAIENDQLISVPSLASAFPADPEPALLAYAQSFSLVDFLLSSYGKEKMVELLLAFKEGRGEEEALREVYGFDMGGLEAGWRESLGLAPQPPAPVVIPISYLILGLLALGLVVLALARWLRRQHK